MKKMKRRKGKKKAVWISLAQVHAVAFWPFYVSVQAAFIARYHCSSIPAQIPSESWRTQIFVSHVSPRPPPRGRHRVFHGAERPGICTSIGRDCSARRCMTQRRMGCMACREQAPGSCPYSAMSARFFNRFIARACACALRPTQTRTWSRQIPSGWELPSWSVSGWDRPSPCGRPHPACQPYKPELMLTPKLISPTPRWVRSSIINSLGSRDCQEYLPPALLRFRIRMLRPAPMATTTHHANPFTPIHAVPPLSRE